MTILSKLAPLALLSVAAGAPAAVADTGKGVHLAFHFDRAAPAETTFARLQRQALNACARVNSHTIISRADRACAKDLVTRAVDGIGDSRLAELNGQPLRQASAGTTISGS